MLYHKKECIPINSKVSEIEGVAAVDSLTTLVSTFLPDKYEGTIPISKVGMNIITPPGE